MSGGDDKTDYPHRLMKTIEEMAITFLFWIYMAVLLRITVFRSNFSFYHLFQNGKVNFTLFQGYIFMIRQGDWFGFFYLFFGNVIWFIPFGMYLQYKNKVKNFWQAALSGLFFSLLIETLQYIFGTGFSELDDLILNSLGAGLGAVFVKYWNK